MNLNLPDNVRKVLYVVLTLLAPILAYLQVKGVVGTAEITAYAAISAAITGMAALNTGSIPGPVDEPSEPSETHFEV